MEDDSILDVSHGMNREFGRNRGSSQFAGVAKCEKFENINLLPPGRFDVHVACHTKYENHGNEPQCRNFGLYGCDETVNLFTLKERVDNRLYDHPWGFETVCISRGFVGRAALLSAWKPTNLMPLIKSGRD